MKDAGEQLVESYLRYIRKCDFVQTNLYTTKSQGEIDVIGLNSKTQTVYVCEVTTHLRDGLQIVNQKTGKTANIEKLTDKFARDIEYAREHLSQFKQHFMLWSPIVKTPKRKSANNQMQHVETVKANILDMYGVELDCIINERYQACLLELRDHAAGESKAIPCPMMRFMQIEEQLRKHLAQ